MESERNLHEKNFLTHYQTLLFRENNAGAFEAASIRRKRIALLFRASTCMADNETTCALLKKKLKSYADIIDNKEEVNNYGECIQELMSFVPNECQKWKSTLSETDISENVNLFHCKNHEVTEKHIQFLLCSRKADTDGEKTGENETSREMTRKNCSTLNTDGLKIYDDKQNYFKPTGLNKIAHVSKSNYPHQNKPKDMFEKDHRQQSSAIDFHSEHSLRNGQAVYNQPPRQQRPNVKEKLLEPGGSSLNKAESLSSEPHRNMDFMTGRDLLKIQNQKKWGNKGSGCSYEYGPQKKSLGSRLTVKSKFVSPMKPPSEDELECEDEKLKNIDPKMIELIRSEIMDSGVPVHWDDIAGLQFAKSTIQEIVVWPMLRPEIFTGLRKPPKGILLFGPPGTGKTLIGKCIASQSHSTFFSISASSLTSKWIGDGEKMVRALFAVARCHQPAVVFIDEIDSLLKRRSDTEHECSRRMKTEFLVQLDGATTGEEDRILVIGATNRPQELDEAARRRLVKRLYIPLPDLQARCEIVQRLMSREKHCLTSSQICEVGTLTAGYSGADMMSICQAAAFGPIRSKSMDIHNITLDQVRPIAFEDFQCALGSVKASVSPRDLDLYVTWNKQYGSG